VLDAVRFRDMGRVIIKYEDEKFYENNIYYVDPSVFDIFTFPVIKGDSKTALIKPYSVVITKEMSEKYFGSKDPVGKVLTFNNKEKFFVTGVIKNLPKTTHREMTG
jgi:putative ABC transport system permease protein